MAAAISEEFGLEAVQFYHKAFEMVYTRSLAIFKNMKNGFNKNRPRRMREKLRWPPSWQRQSTLTTASTGVSTTLGWQVKDKTDTIERTKTMIR